MASPEVCNLVVAELTWDKITTELTELGLMPETEADIDRLVEELVQLLEIIEDGHYVFGAIDSVLVIVGLVLLAIAFSE